MRKVIGKAAFDLQDPSKHRPHGDRLIVKEIEVENAVYAGDKKIIVAGQNEELERGWKLVEVVAIGDGHRLEADVRVPMPFEVGEMLYIERMTGRELRLRGEKFLIINQVDVLTHAPEVAELAALPELERTA